MNYEKAVQAFEKYLENYDQKNPLIKEKYIHTFHVADLMEELAERLMMNEEEIIVAKIIGLLHDIGRFEQIKKYGVVSDKKTNTDHAQESVIYLFEKGHIRDFLEEENYDRVIKQAILNHNKMKIEEKESQISPFTKMIRDMDKVDIYRVYATDYHFEFDAKDITAEVLKEFSTENLIDIHQVKTKIDRIFIPLAFIYDIYYDESFDILVEKDNFDLFLSTVEVTPDSENLWRKIRELCFDKINRGVEGKDETKC